MAAYDYVILGGGMTGASAAKGIRQVDPNGSLAIISAERQPPYDRPPLSKGLWKDDNVSKIWRDIDQFDLDLHIDTRIVRLDPERHELTDEAGQTFRYGKLLLATGGTPRTLPFGEGEILYYRTFDDYERLRELSQSSDRFAVVGGGFIGSELAAALRLNGNEVTMIYPEDSLGANRFPVSLGSYLDNYYQEQGVQLMAGQSVVGIETDGTDTVVVTDADERVRASAVVIGIGIRPNTGLAEAAGLELDNGILVDRSLRASHADIYSAGDVASFFNPALGTTIRVEHEDNANTMGELAGRSMAGELVTYDYLPYFYSDLFDLGYEAVGIMHTGMETVEDWVELGQKGVTYYLSDGRVRGVLLWNVWGEVESARGLIARGGPIDHGELIGRIPSGS